MNIRTKITSSVLAGVMAMAGMACCTANCSSKRTPAPPTAPLDAATGLVASIVITDASTYYATTPKYFPDIGITLTNGYAPFPVFFEGWQSSPRANLVRYDWDFGARTEGDELGRYFDGFNAAHVYETPGIYTVTLTVTDYLGVQSPPATVTITVLARNSAGTYYVDSALGSDSNDGKAATVGGGHGPWQTATKALGMLQKTGSGPYTALLNPGDRVLFNRGQTFALTGNITYNGGNPYLISLAHGQTCQGVQFGAYGAGSKPIIQWQGSADTIPGSSPAAQSIGSLYAAGYGGAYIVWSDLQFNFLNPTNGVQLGGILSGYSAWKNILFLRCDCIDANSNSIWGMEGLDPAPDGIFTVSCTCNNYLTASSGSGTMVYGGPSHLALLNNRFDMSANHIAYLKPVNKGVISKNVFSRPARGRTAIRIDGGPASSSGSPGQSGVAIGQTANNIVVSDNQFLGWVDTVIGGAGRSGGAHGVDGTTYNYKLIDFGANSDGQQIHDQIVFERNVITNFMTGMTVKNTSNMTIRNNLYVSPVAGMALGLNDPSLEYRPLQNVFIYGNTFLTGVHPIDPQQPVWGNYALVQMTPYTSGDTTFGSVDTNVRVFNNIFATYADGAAKVALDLTGAVAGFTSDNNFFYMPNVAGGTFMKLGATALTLADWGTATGYDVHSLSGSPGFAGGNVAELNGGVPGTPSSQAACMTEATQLIAQLQPAAGSMVIDSGANLGAALSNDFLGLARPVDGNGDGISQTDIGAFEYQATK